MRKNVLVIDDDDILRGSVAKGLRQNDFDVITADSAETATEILNRVKIDAIVLDRMMPGMDGLSALANWRAAGITTPVIMLTAMGGPENTIDGLSGGANDYLAKPFQLKELVLRLRNIIGRHYENIPDMPPGLNFVDNEFFVNGKLLALSSAEKDLLRKLTTPVGNVVNAAPMTARRLRAKLYEFIPTIDILTIRTKGYKIVRK